MLRNLWLRAVVVHPVLFVGPLVAACYLLAGRDGSDLSAVDWGLAGIPLAAGASLFATVQVMLNRPLTRRTRALIIAVSVAVSVIAVVLGLLAWADAAETACHGRYECPF